MLNLLIEIDSAIKCNNASNLEILFKAYINVIRILLPFIPDKTVRDVFCNNIEQSKPSQEDLSNGRLDFSKLNPFFMQASKDLNDSVNNWPCDNPKPPTCAPEPAEPSLLNLKLLNGLSAL